MRSAQLLILPPKGTTVRNVTAVSVGKGGGAITVGVLKAVPNGKGFVSLPLSVSAPDKQKGRGSGRGGRGRVRVVVQYSDGTSSSVHYYVLPPFSTQVDRLGTHLAHVAWLPRSYPDPFGRSASVCFSLPAFCSCVRPKHTAFDSIFHAPSKRLYVTPSCGVCIHKVMPWDRSANGGKGAHVMNDARAYDVGLSDDAGGGNPLCLASKVHAAPSQDEVSRIDE